MINLLSSLFGASKFQSLSGEEFKSHYKSDKGAVLLDVRTPREFSSGTLPGAKNIDFTAGSFKSNVSKLDKNNTYYLFCRSGARSSSACGTMSSMGFKVFNLRGGIGAWPR